MLSEQLYPTNNNLGYSQPGKIQINYNSYQPSSFQNSQYINTIPQEYPVTHGQKSLINNINFGDITYTTLNENPTVNITPQINSSQINSYEAYPATNYKKSYQQNVLPISNQIDYNINNNEIDTNLNIDNIQNENNNINEINQKSEIENKIPSSILNNANQINLDDKKMESILKQFESTIAIDKNLERINTTPLNNPLKNPLLETVTTKQLNKTVSPRGEFDNESKNLINTPRLVNPLETRLIPSPSMPSMRNEKEEKKEENLAEFFEQIQNKNLTKDEKILLQNEKEVNKKDLDLKSHFDLTLIKDENEFFYKKVHKVSTPLLAHYEMPENLEYKSPILSPNEKYLACIGKGDEDSVFVWEISDLYWYKYKFSYSNVDCIAFTPNSKGIIIVYSNSNPILYDLSTGKMQLEFEKNEEEENNREILQCAFTNMNTHFALTTTSSFTLWSLRTGKIKQIIFDNSPIKIISNEHIIHINSELNCTIKKISDQSIIENFLIKGVESTEEILDARCTKDMTNLIYVIKHGIIVYNFKKKEFNGLQKFQCGVEKATLSEDGKYIIKTNMKDFAIYDLEKGTNINTILKDKFKEYNVDFTLKKILTIDNLSITIQDFLEDNSPEKYVWLNKNPTKFEEVKFSSDFKILLGRLNRNDAVAYDLKTGFIIKKWENLDENWLDYCITTFGGDKIATKVNLFLINVWNYSTKKEEASFYGFNSHSLFFSSDGTYLASGAKNGSEIARIWNIPDKKYGIFKFNGNNNNFNTVVHLTYPVPEYLICCSVDQKPLIFNSNTKELLHQCECPYRFEEIYEIQSELRYNIFIIKARDNKKRNIGILYRLSDGALLNTYENYTVLDLVRFEGIVISKCNDTKLISTDYKILDNPESVEFRIQSDKCLLMNDHKSAIVEFGDDEFNKEFNLINVQNGNFIGKLNYVKKRERYSEIFITADCDTEEIYFRYFEFLTPQETMVYLKKNIFNVEEINV